MGLKISRAYSFLLVLVVGLIGCEQLSFGGREATSNTSTNSALPVQQARGFDQKGSISILAGAAVKSGDFHD